MNRTKDLSAIVTEVRSRSKQGSEARVRLRPKIAFMNEEEEETATESDIFPSQPSQNMMKTMYETMPNAIPKPRQNKSLMMATAKTGSVFNNSKTPMAGATNLVHFQTFHGQDTHQALNEDFSAKKLRKLEVLSATDKETIETQ